MNSVERKADSGFPSYVSFIKGARELPAHARDVIAEAIRQSDDISDKKKFLLQAGLEKLLMGFGLGYL